MRNLVIEINILRYEMWVRREGDEEEDEEREERWPTSDEMGMLREYLKVT